MVDRVVRPSWVKQAWNWLLPARAFCTAPWCLRAALWHGWCAKHQDIAAEDK
jgi:hypothetical protein